MTLLSKPTEIVKGTPANFVLDKTGLSQLSFVQADDYFRDPLNWSQVVLVYVSPVGGVEKIYFDAAYLQPASQSTISARAREEFTLQSIIIYDFDNGYLMIPKEEVPSADFTLKFAVQVLPTLDKWAAMSKVFSLSKDYVTS